jgi:hypothetical protein
MIFAMTQFRQKFLLFLFSISLLSFTQARSAMAADLKETKRPTTVSPFAVTPSTAAKAADSSPQAQTIIVDAPAASATVGATPLPGGTGQANSSTTPPTPLTPAQKFKYSLRSSFKPPTPYALSALSGVFSEAIDNDHHRHMTAGDFLADSATHAARSMAFRSTANFFEKFAFAAAFHQDPRYFRSDKHGFARIGYALSRVFITQGDNGHNQFNASFFAGGLVTAGISNVWSRPEDRTVSSTMGRFGLHVAYRGLSNVIHEMFGRH